MILFAIHYLYEIKPLGLSIGFYVLMGISVVADGVNYLMLRRQRQRSVPATG
jgi:hypothetical protein